VTTIGLLLAICIGSAATIIDAARSGWHRTTCWSQTHGDATVVIAGGPWGVPIVVDDSHRPEPPDGRTSELLKNVSEAPESDPAAEEVAMLELLWQLS
jgi:hypothetical protein